MVEIETTFDALRRFDRVRVGDVDWNVDRVTSTHGMIVVNLSALHNPARIGWVDGAPVAWVDTPIGTFGQLRHFMNPERF